MQYNALERKTVSLAEVDIGELVATGKRVCGAVIGGREIEAENFREVFAEFARFAIESDSEKFGGFIAGAGWWWVGKGKAGMLEPAGLGGGWFYDKGEIGERGAQRHVLDLARAMGLDAPRVVLCGGDAVAGDGVTGGVADEGDREGLGGDEEEAGLGGGVESAECGVAGLIRKWEAESQGAIGKYVKAALKYVLQRELLTESELEELYTPEGTKKHLEMSLKGCPLFGDSQLIDKNGYSRSWQEPIVAGGRSIYANKEWLERSRDIFNRWLVPVLRREAKKETPGGAEEAKEVVASTVREPSDVVKGAAEKIGAYVKRKIYAAIREGRIPEEDFNKLLTLEGTREVLGWSMSGCPLFSYSPMVGPDGRGNNSWGDPVFVGGKSVHVNSQWKEHHREKAEKLIGRWEGNEAVNEMYLYSDGRISAQPFAGKKPVALIVEDEEIALDGVWRNLVVGTVEHLFGKYGEKLVEGVGRAGTAVFAMVKDGMREPWLHEASGIWLEMNMSAQRCVSASRALFGICGADLGNIGLVYCGEGTESPSRKSVTIVEEPDDGEIEALEADLRTNYKNGFDFSATSMRLVEGRTGIAFNDGVVRCLQRRMFERRDGIWFFEDQIADSELTNEIVLKCEQWLTASPIATVSQFVKIAELRTRNLHDELDIGKFAERAILHSPFGAGCDFLGKRGGRICFIAGIGADASKKAFAEKVEDVLRERCDAVGIIELADLFPMVSADWMKTNLPRLIADVVVEDLGEGGEALKLLEFYYLPDDFGEALKSLHDALTADGETLSAARILAGLDEHYGCDFKESYALTGDTFKQIAARATCGQFEWSGSILRKASEERKDAASFREIVESEFTGIFTTGEFLKFATRIWSSAEAYLHAQLRENFVRHDEDHWSSIGHFKAATGWNEETERQIGDKLQELLGARSFFQMGETPEQFLDGLPAIEMDGRETRWTLELFASVAEFCVPAMKSLNHGALPDETTTLLVPGDAAGDAVEYMTKVFMERNPKNPFRHSDGEYLDMATAFLIENGVRRRTSEKLRAKVSAILGSGAN